MTALWRAVAERPAADGDGRWRGKWQAQAGVLAQARRWRHREDCYLATITLEAASGETLELHDDDVFGAPS